MSSIAVSVNYEVMHRASLQTDGKLGIYLLNTFVCSSYFSRLLQYLYWLNTKKGYIHQSRYFLVEFLILISLIWSASYPEEVVDG